VRRILVFATAITGTTLLHTNFFAIFQGHTIKTARTGGACTFSEADRRKTAAKGGTESGGDAQTAITGLAFKRDGAATLIDLTVAIVVDFVRTLLNGRADFAAATAPFACAQAGFAPIFAGPFATGRRRPVVARTRISGTTLTTIVINLTIAIVVDVVKTGFFGSRKDFTCTGTPLAVALAGTNPIFAGSITDIGTIWLFSAPGGSAVADVLIPGFADTATFVHLTIAIVVLLVATLFGAGGLDLSIAIAPFFVLTKLCTGTTGSKVLGPRRTCVADAGRARDALSCIATGVVIRFAIAIVVFLITDFRGRLLFTDASAPLSLLTGLKSLFAASHPFCS
jgi:hypothetical protein